MEWQPIDTFILPTKNGEDSEAVLIWDGYRCAVSHCTSYTGSSPMWWIDESYGYNEDGEIHNPTHWMPLPAPPATDVEDENTR